MRRGALSSIPGADRAAAGCHGPGAETPAPRFDVTPALAQNDRMANRTNGFFRREARWMLVLGLVPVLLALLFAVVVPWALRHAW
jgi:hypothetical protein